MNYVYFEIHSLSGVGRFTNPPNSWDTIISITVLKVDLVIDLEKPSASYTKGQPCTTLYIVNPSCLNVFIDSKAINVGSF